MLSPGLGQACICSLIQHVNLVYCKIPDLICIVQFKGMEVHHLLLLLTSRAVDR